MEGDARDPPSANVAAAAGLRTNVFSVNLAKLATLIHCSPEELYTTLHKEDHASDIEGTLVLKDVQGGEIVFEVEEDEPKTFDPPRTTTALISAASRPGELDTTRLPKELIVLEGTNGLTVIELVLRCLYRAGIERVYILLGWASSKIQEVLENSTLTELLEIIYIDLGEHYNAGHARSLIKARRNLAGQGPFLLCTSDHVFDPRIVYELANTPLPEPSRRRKSSDPERGRHSLSRDVEHGMSTLEEERVRGIVLVENNFDDMLDSLPGTAVKVRFRPDDFCIEEIGRHVTDFNGIEAGLFLLNSEIFETLIDLAADKLYFSLADALARMADDGLVVARPTYGMQWTSVETQGQLEETQDMLDEEGGFRFVGPWDVKVVKLPQAELTEVPTNQQTATTRNPPAPLSHYLLLGVPMTPGTNVHLVGGASEEVRQDFLVGFVVPVRPSSGAPSSPPTGKRELDNSKEIRKDLNRKRQRKAKDNPVRNKLCRAAMLLPMGAPPIPAENEKTESSTKLRDNSQEDDDVKLEELEAASPYALAVPIKDIEDLDLLWGRHRGLLFSAPSYEDGGSIGGEKQRLLLAIAGIVIDEDSHHTRTVDQMQLVDVGTLMHTPRVMRLPMDILDIDIQADVKEYFDAKPKLTVTLKRKVPMLGWAMLAVALVTIAATGSAVKLQGHAPMLLKTCWRHQCSAIIFGVLSLYAYLAYVQEARERARRIQTHSHHTHTRGHAVPLTHNGSITSLSSGERVSRIHTSVPNSEVAYLPLGSAPTNVSEYSVVHQSIWNGVWLWMHVLLAGLGFAWQVDGFVTSLSVSSLPQATLLSNLTAILVMIYNIFMPDAKRPSLLDFMGLAVALLGAIACTIDSFTAIRDDWQGHLIAASSAVGGFVFLINAKLLRSEIDLFLLMFLMQVIGTISSTALSISTIKCSTFTLDPTCGVFGWLSGHMILVQLGVCFVLDAVGYILYLCALRYMDPLMASVALLATPAVVLLEAIALGVGSVPGTWTICGCVALCIGCVLVFTGASGEQYETIDVSSSLETTDTGTGPGDSDQHTVAPSVAPDMNMWSWITRPLQQTSFPRTGQSASVPNETSSLLGQNYSNTQGQQALSINI